MDDPAEGEGSAEDVFTSNDTPEMGSFLSNAHAPVPTHAPATFRHQFTLNPVPTPAACNKSVESLLSQRHDGSHRLSNLQMCKKVENVHMGQATANLAALRAQLEDAPFQMDAEVTDSEDVDTASVISEKKTFSNQHEGTRDGKLREAPSQVAALDALNTIKDALRGKSKGKGGGFRPPDLDTFVRTRMEGMRALLELFTNTKSATYDKWAASSLQAAVSLGRGTFCARALRALTRAYIKDRTILPLNPYGNWNSSMLMDEALCADINIYLLEQGDHITAENLVQFLTRPDIKEKHGISKTITVRTAQRYLQALGFRFTHAKKGQYTDGHERADVVEEREKVFIPAWQSFSMRMRFWKGEDVLVEDEKSLDRPGRRVVVWFHDETIFYANDRRRLAWYHKDADAKPYAKGDGASLMIAHAVSADYGWLVSKDKKRSARHIFKPGKSRDGYFQNEDVLEQFREMVEIAKAEYPDDDHVFVYDNATTHKKRPANAPSARSMPKFTPKPGKNWLVEVNKVGADGRPIKNSEGGYEKTRVPMADTTFNGQPQSFYFPEGHPRAGVFKGMQVILEERGRADIAQKRAACKDFKCPPGVRDCCCRRYLYTEPDFAQGESNLEMLAKELGVRVIFLPKFHCELNPIEQCWGRSKFVYRFFPPSSREDQLLKNALAALEEVNLGHIRK